MGAGPAKGAGPNVWSTCNEPVCVRVSSLGGDAWDVAALGSWTVAKVKAELERLAGVPRWEQRLVCGLAPLRDGQFLGELSLGDRAGSLPEGHAARLEVTLVRRSREQAEWLQRVAESAHSLREAPDEIRADHEVVLAASLQDPALVFCAAELLLEERQFVEDAIRQRGGPALDALASRTAWPAAQDGNEAAAAFGWLRAPVDAKLALRAASHLRSPELAAAVLQSPAVQLVHAATEEERVHLAAEPLNTPESIRKLLQGLPREAVCVVLRRSTLGRLELGLELLDLHAAAQNRGAMRRMGRFLFGGSPLEAINGRLGLLEPGAFAMALFAQHQGALLGDAGLFVRLMGHLEGVPTPDVETCCSLVRVCLAHRRTEQARAFFVKGSDASASCASLLGDDGLPLDVLRAHPHRAELLARVLEDLGGPAGVLTAAGADGCSVRALVDAASHDPGLAELCMTSRQVFADALRLAVEGGAEAPGCVLLRVLAMAQPDLPLDFPVPVQWLGALRGASRCRWLATEMLLQSLEGAPDHELDDLTARFWGLVDWQGCSADQLARAVGVLARAGAACELQEGRSPEGRLEARRRLVDALAALSLDRLEDPMLCADPRLPPQALGMVALERSRAAERRAADAEERAKAAERRAQEAEARALQAGRRAERLESRVASLEARPR